MSQITANHLQKIPLLSVIPESGLALIAEVAKRRFLRAGEVLFTEGTPSETIWFIVEGRIALTMKADEGKIGRLTMLEDGETLCELSLVEKNVTHLCTAAADEETLLVEITQADFQKLNENWAKLALTLQRIIRSDMNLKLSEAGAALRPILIRSLAG